MARYALVIGIAKYDNFRNLDKAATDAEAIAHLLEQHRYTVTRMPRKLVSENQGAIDPTKKLTATELGAELKTFFTEKASRQPAVVYFAGHGFRVTNSLTGKQVGYLATSDSTQTGQNAICMDDLNILIGDSELGSLVMLLDCCHAGTLMEQRSWLQPTQGMIGQKQNYCLIAACRDFERAREGTHHGIFTAAVLQGLSRENAMNGEITSNDLFGFVSRKLRSSGQEVICQTGASTPIPLVNYSPFLLGGNPSDTSPSLLLQTLLPLLQQIDDTTIAQQVYRQVLPPDASLFWSEVTTAGAMVQHLWEVRRLSDFIQGLIQDERVPQDVRHSLKDVWQQFSQAEGWVQPASLPTAPAQISQYYLQIALRRDQCSDRLVINGWLVPKNRVAGVDKDFQSLDLESQQNGKPCQLEEVPKIVDQYLEKSQTILLGKRYQLTIEIFLPLDYLCEAVDSWKITDSDLEDDELVPLGAKYQVLVRTYDRITTRYRIKRHNDWHNNWDRVKVMWDRTPNPNDFEHLSDYCSCNWKRVANNLMTQKLGLKLTCGLVAEHQEAMLRALHNSATPIAIWARCNLSHLDQALELDDLIASTPLASLSAAVMQKRVDADCEEVPTMHLGTHLALLWEDPDRLTPDALAQLKPPGK